LTVLIGFEGVAPGSSLQTGGKQLASMFAANATATLRKIAVHGGGTAWGAGNGYVGIFADEEYEAGKHRPGALLGQEKLPTLPGEGWVTASGFVVPLMEGVNYWLALMDTVSWANFRFTPGGTETVRSSTASTYTQLTETAGWNALPDGPLSIYGIVGEGPPTNLQVSRAELFPSGTVVRAHPARTGRFAGPPSAGVLASGTVDATGVLRMTVPAGVELELWALVGGEHRYLTWGGPSAGGVPLLTLRERVAARRLLAGC
jgi:hypothetical protein